MCFVFLSLYNLYVAESHYFVSIGSLSSSLSLCFSRCIYLWKVKSLFFKHTQKAFSLNATSSNDYTQATATEKNSPSHIHKLHRLNSHEEGKNVLFAQILRQPQQQVRKNFSQTSEQQQNKQTNQPQQQ